MAELQAALHHMDVKKAVFLRLFFPVIFLWDGIKALGHTITAKAYGKYFIPAAKEPSTRAPRTKSKFGKKRIVLTPDGCRLDTLDLSNPDPLDLSLPPKNKKYIIQFGDGKTGYEKNISSLKETAAEHQSHVIAFNYRGVGRSTGHTTVKGAATDGISQVLALLQQGATLGNITLKADNAFSSAVATKVAAYFYRHGKEHHVLKDHGNIKLLRQNTPASLSDLIMDQSFANKTPWDKLKRYFARPFVKLGLMLAKSDIDVTACNAYINKHEKPSQPVLSTTSILLKHHYQLRPKAIQPTITSQSTNIPGTNDTIKDLASSKYTARFLNEPCYIKPTNKPKTNAKKVSFNS